MKKEVLKLVTFDNDNNIVGARHAVLSIEEIHCNKNSIEKIVDIRTGLEVDPFQDSHSSSIEKMKQAQPASFSSL
jgi:hypothetical protein